MLAGCRGIHAGSQEVTVNFPSQLGITAEMHTRYHYGTTQFVRPWMRLNCHRSLICRKPCSKPVVASSMRIDTDPLNNIGSFARPLGITIYYVLQVYMSAQCCRPSNRQTAVAARARRERYHYENLDMSKSMQSRERGMHHNVSNRLYETRRHLWFLWQQSLGTTCRYRSALASQSVTQGRVGSDYWAQ